MTPKAASASMPHFQDLCMRPGAEPGRARLRADAGQEIGHAGFVENQA